METNRDKILKHMKRCQRLRETNLYLRNSYVSEHFVDHVSCSFNNKDKVSLVWTKWNTIKRSKDQTLSYFSGYFHLKLY